MRRRPSRPFRVLDLACGAGLVRVAVARRVAARRIHYTGIDRTRQRLEKVDAILRAAERKAPTAAGAQAPAGTNGEAAEALQARLRERFVKAELDLNQPDTLAAQLGGLLGRERFDEVHVHLLHPRTHGCQPTGPKVLKTVARYLRPGGRIYHLFQHSSPFFDFKPEFILPSREGSCPAPGSKGDVIGRDQARFVEGAARAGLVLDKCGHRWKKWRPYNEPPPEAAGSHENWVTRRYAGSEPDRRIAEVYHQAAEQYSGFSKFASHFVILRKPARKARPLARASAAATAAG